MGRRAREARSAPCTIERQIQAVKRLFEKHPPEFRATAADLKRWTVMDLDFEPQELLKILKPAGSQYTLVRSEPPAHTAEVTA